MIVAKHNPIDHAQREKERALALAALVQAACLVERLAQSGKVDETYFKQTFDALLDKNYIAERSFYHGATKLKSLLRGHEISHAKNILSHASTLIAIEKQLHKDAPMLSTIADGMSRIHKQAQYFGSPYHTNIIAAVSHLYGETISTRNPRVIVRGKPEFLKQAHNTDRIRCLLFSGIRAASAWRTNGGNTFRLVFGRKKIIQHLKSNQHGL